MYDAEVGYRQLQSHGAKFHLLGYVQWLKLGAALLGASALVLLSTAARGSAVKSVVARTDETELTSTGDEQTTDMQQDAPREDDVTINELVDALGQLDMEGSAEDGDQSQAPRPTVRPHAMAKLQEIVRDPVKMQALMQDIMQMMSDPTMVQRIQQALGRVMKMIANPQWMAKMQSMMSNINAPLPASTAAGADGNSAAAPGEPTASPQVFAQTVGQQIQDMFKDPAKFQDMVQQAQQMWSNPETAQQMRKIMQDPSYADWMNHLAGAGGVDPGGGNVGGPQ
eukprot:gnl/TRDRNA2_/TRDRNA2_192559_c0_seq1.p1 gnl/TRDRNA2_/TRDRNA2_192559_c0~~gnl/TRDRNA2_/TRDRNA2_192559_c0_seq1.p1  ORF type:complete len:282 (+),score=61.78 gnl/TRDRNA2_/TRDRNA2_192559_c0_seq1:58-903(+)